MARGRELSQSGNLKDRPTAGIPVSSPLLRAAQRAWRAAQRGRLTLAEGQDCARPKCSRRGLKRHYPSRSYLCPGVPVPDPAFYLKADPESGSKLCHHKKEHFPLIFLRMSTFNLLKKTNKYTLCTNPTFYLMADPNPSFAITKREILTFTSFFYEGRPYI
jgi:hypothetical protein